MRERFFPFSLGRLVLLAFFSICLAPAAFATDLPWREHCLAPGETAAEVALRFGISEADLLWANDLRGQRCPETGMTLLVPCSGEELLATLLEARARSRGETTEDLHVERVGFTFPDLKGKADTTERQQASREQAPREQAFIWPLKGKISSGFGRRGARFHNGVDIPAPKGTAIVAARSGRIVFTGSIRGFGRTIRVDHGNGVETLYAHCTALLVKKGEWVRQGQKIATVGRTGRATCNHLHFSVFVGGKARDPKGYLP